jgi:hypothetical protein
MSLANLIEIGLTVLCLGAVIGFWFYAARYAAPREVLLLLGDSLVPSGRRDRRERNP